MSMPILLLNAGSSSIKYQVIDAEDETVLATGLIGRIGEASSTIKHKTQGETFEAADRYADHTEALAAVSYTHLDVYKRQMMVYLGLADGMVSGAVNTTANTIRPSLEFVKTKPGVQVVSS